MLIRRAEHSKYLSNSYLVADEQSRKAVIVDGHGEGQSLIDHVRSQDLDVTMIVLTHHHVDHVDVGQFVEAFGSPPVFAHEITAGLLDDGVVTDTVADRETLRTGSLELEMLLTPGHAAGHLAVLVDGSDCITADTIFRGTVGGTKAPGATGIRDLKRSILETILGLPDTTVLHPGHCEPTSVAQELGHNPFVRAWRGDDTFTPRPCRVADEPAELLVWGPDYDGTNKAWVRIDGEEAVVGGSQVQRDD